jgi:glycosyltransferase involved in cell wall biosynthesis
MSCKKPVLMAIDGVSRQLVEDAECGVYVEPENIEEYDRNIRGYLQDQERLKREGNNGYAYAKINFDRMVLAEKYLKEIKIKTGK